MDCIPWKWAAIDEQFNKQNLLFLKLSQGLVLLQSKIESWSCLVRIAMRLLVRISRFSGDGRLASRGF